MSHSSTLSSTSDGKERKLESADALRAFGPSSKMAGSFRPPTILGPQVGRGGFMSISKPAVEADSHRSARRALVREKHVRQQHATTAAQLNNALAREDALLREKSDLLRRHEMMAQEFEHRLFNRDRKS